MNKIEGLRQIVVTYHEGNEPAMQLVSNGEEGDGCLSCDLGRGYAFRGHVSDEQWDLCLLCLLADPTVDKIEIDK